MDITLGKMASWIFGVLLIIAGLGAFMTNLASGIIYFVTGLFLIPNVREKISENYDINFSRWVVVLIAFIGIGLGGAMMQGSMETSNSTTPVDSQEPTSDDQIESGEQTEVENTKESRTHSIGNEFTVGDVRYQVNGVTTRQEIGERSYGTLIGVEANGKFLLVDMTVMNEANQAVRMRESSVKLMIDEAEYGTNSEAWAYMDDSFTFEQLNPGVQVDGNLAYDVPSSASMDTMELEVSPVGLFSTAEPHYVELGS